MRRFWSSSAAIACSAVTKNPATIIPILMAFVTTTFLEEDQLAQNKSLDVFGNVKVILNIKLAAGPSLITVLHVTAQGRRSPY